VLSFGVVYERDWDSLQQLVEDAPPARAYFSDGFPTYAQLCYPAGGTYTQLTDKSQTYSVEGDNAELRHYLARLARKSRCFSRCLWALGRAVGLFVYAWNRRQEFRRRFPRLPAHVCDFVADL
jgi:IS1 family transposase